MSLSIPEIVDGVLADFQAQGSTVPVLFGAFNVSAHSGATRVIIGLDTFDFGDPGPPNAPGLADLGNGTTARSIASREQVVKVWCFAAPPMSGVVPPQVMTRTVQKNASILVHNTAAALYRFAFGSYAIALGGGEWPDADKVPGIVYGSLAVFRAKFWIPVLDLPLPLVMPDPVASTAQVIFRGDSGDQVAAHIP